jgi:general secretion pathway protein C
VPERTTPKEWALALGGGLVLAAGLVAVLRPTPAAMSAGGVELTGTPPELPAALPDAAVVDAGPRLSGLVLRGVLGPDSVIVEGGDGRQRLLRRGRDPVWGMALVEVRGNSAVLADAGGGRVTLVLEGAVLEAEPAPAAADATGPRRVRRAALAASVTDYRLALVPMGPPRNSGQSRDIESWRVKDAAGVPLLRAAGLAAGDVLTAVNGQMLFSEEKLMDLPDDVAGARELRIDYLRRGARNTVSLEIID